MSFVPRFSKENQGVERGRVNPYYGERWGCYRAEWSCDSDGSMSRGRSGQVRGGGDRKRKKPPRLGKVPHVLLPKDPDVPSGPHTRNGWWTSLLDMDWAAAILGGVGDAMGEHSNDWPPMPHCQAMGMSERAGTEAEPSLAPSCRSLQSIVCATLSDLLHSASGAPSAVSPSIHGYRLYVGCNGWPQPIAPYSIQGWLSMLQQWQTRQVNRSVLRLLDFLLACTGLVLSCEVINESLIEYNSSNI
jgi:hypothetical protein